MTVRHHRRSKNRPPMLSAQCTRYCRHMTEEEVATVVPVVMVAAMAVKRGSDGMVDTAITAVMDAVAPMVVGAPETVEESRCRIVDRSLCNQCPAHTG